MFALRTLRELKLLRYFAEQQVSENIISIVDIIKPTSLDSFKEVSGAIGSVYRPGLGAELIYNP